MAQTVRPSHKRDKAMSNNFDLTDAGEPMVYHIRVKGHLGREWSDWFEGLTIQLTDDGETLLIGQVVGQAALYGVLRKVRDVGMPLLLVIRIEPGKAETPDVKP